MKELYVKPMIAIESFSLCQSIARHCDNYHISTAGEATHYNEDTCVWDAGGFTFFYEDHCDYSMDADSWEIEGACYNNPEGAVGIFSST